MTYTVLKCLPRPHVLQVTTIGSLANAEGRNAGSHWGNLDVANENGR